METSNAIGIVSAVYKSELSTCDTNNQNDDNKTQLAILKKLNNNFKNYTILLFGTFGSIDERRAKLMMYEREPIYLLSVKSVKQKGGRYDCFPINMANLQVAMHLP